MDMWSRQTKTEKRSFQLSFPASLTEWCKAAPGSSFCPVAAVSDEPTLVQVSINTNTLWTVNHQTGEVKGADESHQKSQRTEDTEPLQPSKDEDFQCCCCSGRRAHLHLCSAELCSSTGWSKNLTCTHFMCWLANVASTVNVHNSLTGARGGGSAELRQRSCCIWRHVTGLLEGLFNSVLLSSFSQKGREGREWEMMLQINTLLMCLVLHTDAV